MEHNKPVHSLVLDAGPIIKNEPAVSSLTMQAERLYTVPAIIHEIKDSQARSRIQTTLQPFLTIQSPNPKSVKVVSDFARRTGDLAVLSKADIEIIALTYDLECERNHGDWRLRSVPGQKKLNGSPPSRVEEASQEKGAASPALAAQEVASSVPPGHAEDPPLSTIERRLTVDEQGQSSSSGPLRPSSEVQPVAHQDEKLITEVAEAAVVSNESATEDGLSGDVVEDDSGSDSDGWITPSNLKRQLAKDSGASAVDNAEPATMQAAVLTSDFAMQNVILQMNLNLLSSSLQRVKHLKTYVLRCHACFQTTKDMGKQFCPRCGQATLTRVACSTNANGEFKLHLKKNMQWNTRGDRYSVPKPAHGSANQRVKGGGKGGWGHDLILAEDQKEYERARVVEKKQKERSLMDEDYLPSILTGDRSRGSGRIKVGAGKNVNSRKR